MPKRDFYPQTLGDLLPRLQLQMTQWSAHYAAFGLTTAQRDTLLTSIQGQIDAISDVYLLQQNVAQAQTTRDEGLTTFSADYRARIQQYKNQVGIDPSLFAAFDWNGQNQGKPDPDTAKPRITGTHQAPKQNAIDFVRGPFDGVDAELSFDGATWTKGEFDSRSPYEDRRANQQAGVPEWRHYRFLYRFEDQPFGQYSETISLLTDIP